MLGWSRGRMVANVQWSRTNSELASDHGPRILRQIYKAESKLTDDGGRVPMAPWANTSQRPNSRMPGPILVEGPDKLVYRLGRRKSLP